MIGVFYYLLCIAVGFIFVSLCAPGVMYFTKKSYSGKSIDISPAFIVLPMSVIFGTLLMAWPTYFIAYFFRSHSNSLTYANAIVILLATAFIVFGIIKLNGRAYKNLELCVDTLKKYELIAFGIIFAFVTIVMFYTFFVADDRMCIGFTVYSDFATHLDMIRSFSYGNNFPTTYSHYAGLDVKYHFMFQFLVGNLEYLGARIDVAFNLPSVINLFSVSLLIYALAIKLFAKRAVGFISIAFFFFRSSSSLFEYVAKIDGGFKNIKEALRNNYEYIGETANENWGLYNINVYGNQRHLAFGLASILIVIILMIPTILECRKKVLKGENFKERFNIMFFSKEAWLPKNTSLAIILGIFLGLTSFFNGACVIGGLLVLFFMALASHRRTEYLMIASISVLLSFLQTSFFMEGNSMNFRWDPGYLAQVKTFFGITKFTLTLLGVLPIIIIGSMLIVNGFYKWIAFCFMTPYLFAVTFQLTTDVSVNHKYVMIGCMLVSVFAAAFVYWLFNVEGIMTKVVSVVLLICLISTGVYDFSCYLKKNDPKLYCVRIDMKDPATLWVMENTNAQDIFLTSWVSLSNLTVGGAMLYYGWPYFAWSAGYDTMSREVQVKAMYEADNSETLKALISANDIRYVVVDYEVRHTTNFAAREDIISQTYARVFTMNEGENALNIYDTRQVLN